jgi:hypothetical protein
MKAGAGSAQALQVCREGKPLHTFPDRALGGGGSRIEVRAVVGEDVADRKEVE